MIDGNMNYALGNALSQTSPDNASLDKTNDLQSLVNMSAASRDYDPALVGKILEYLYNNSTITCLNATERGHVMYPYVMNTGFYAYDRATISSPATTWLNK